MVPLYALIQQKSNPCHRSRIIAANNILNAIFMVISALMIISLITAGVDIPHIFLIVAVLNILILIIITRKEPEFITQFVKYAGF